MSERMEMAAPNGKFVKRILYRGLQGEDVRWLQEMMDELNQHYKFCPVRSLQTSGYYGDTTHKFVKFFQYYCDLLPDGFYDRRTHDALEATYKNYLAELGTKLQSVNPKKQYAY
ncbi:MAG TPA: peptidoglycan-binding domain-containing protein [Pyrinomonadaceae bacterium]